MKKQLIGVLICLMMLATIPIAAGMNCTTEPTCAQPAGDTELGKTFVIGFIFGARFMGNTVSFRSVMVRYRILGQGTAGNVNFPHKMTFRGGFKTGIMTGHFVCAFFNGEPNII
jgi:hypothetical protein